MKVWSCSTTVLALLHIYGNRFCEMISQSPYSETKKYWDKIMLVLNNWGYEVLASDTYIDAVYCDHSDCHCTVGANSSSAAARVLFKRHFSQSRSNNKAVPTECWWAEQSAAWFCSTGCSSKQCCQRPCRYLNTTMHGPNQTISN